MTNSKPVSELARKLADTLIRKIVTVALECVEMRWDFHPTEEENGMGDLQDCIKDTIRCLNGEEFGCLDPDDEEDAEKIQQYINEYASDIETVATLTRKQTIEECARKLEAVLDSDLPTDRLLGIDTALEVIRKMEVGV